MGLLVNACVQDVTPGRGYGGAVSGEMKARENVKHRVNGGERTCTPYWASILSFQRVMIV